VFRDSVVTEFDFDVELVTTQVYLNTGMRKPQSNTALHSGRSLFTPVHENNKPESYLPWLSEASRPNPSQSLAALLEADDVVKLMGYLETSLKQNDQYKAASGTPQDCRCAMLEAYKRLKATVTKPQAVVAVAEYNQGEWEDTRIKLPHGNFAQNMESLDGEPRPIVNYRRKPILIDVTRHATSVVNSNTTSESATRHAQKCSSVIRSDAPSQVPCNSQLLLSAVERAADKLILEENQERAFNTHRPGPPGKTTSDPSNVSCAPFTTNLPPNKANSRDGSGSLFELCPEVLHPKVDVDIKTRKPVLERESSAFLHDTSRLEETHQRLRRSRRRKFSYASLGVASPVGCKDVERDNERQLYGAYDQMECR
jgi:hypothetical protein